MARNMAAAPERPPDAPVASEVQAQVRQFLQRPYRKVIRGSAEEGYLAEVPDLPGCMTAGETEMEALANLPEAMEAWLISVVERGLPVPPPQAPSETRHNGRILLRVPKSLHGQLLERAEAEGVSLNQLLLTYVGLGMGRLHGAGSGEQDRDSWAEGGSLPPIQRSKQASARRRTSRIRRGSWKPWPWRAYTTSSVGAPRRFRAV